MRITRQKARTVGAAILPSRRALGLVRGFTLIELTAVVAIITVLTSLLCAALNQTKNKALRISCLDNLKQLNLAWQMYSEDFDGALPLNQTAGVALDHRFPRFNTSTNSWVAGNPRTDLSTANIRRGTLFPYVKSVAPYRCAMDESRVESRPELKRVRSYAMNAYLGGDDAMNPALNFAELRRPTSTFVFIEEHENSRWESSFVVVPAVKPGLASGTQLPSWVSTPSDRHDQGCNISFADGRIEYWRWDAPKGQRDTMMSSGAGGRRDARDLSRLQSNVGQ
jgi:prepilin-type N-terminal cleavage/methylation domain-containing protein/prepilin-type processing-associated H-X9-DG protein